MMEKNKLKLKTWFQELNDREKNHLKEMFIKEFKVSDVAFYRSLQNENLPVSRAMFFAQYFNILVEDLFRHPLDVKGKKEENKGKKTFSQITNSYGLVAP